LRLSRHRDVVATSLDGLDFVAMNPSGSEITASK
jgi:hypothetical protein